MVSTTSVTDGPQDVVQDKSQLASDHFVAGGNLAVHRQTRISWSLPKPSSCASALWFGPVMELC